METPNWKTRSLIALKFPDGFILQPYPQPRQKVCIKSGGIDQAIDMTKLSKLWQNINLRKKSLTVLESRSISLLENELSL